MTYSTEAPKLRAFLIGLQVQDETPQESQASLQELFSLCETLDMEACGSVLLKVRSYQSDFLLGKGNVAYILKQAEEQEADVLIFDAELSPSQQRNWDRISDFSILDRPGVIIGIFSAKAQTREARLQVDLARLKYELPRLAFSYKNLSRQRGGFFGNKGSGETKIELDRRQIREEIHEVQEELKKVILQRDLLRKNRRQKNIPVIALTGYTNAGKSSLHKRLSQNDTFVKDALFATLDPSARKIHLPKAPACILVDTVGFIRKLPHSLIEAFKATLEEVNQADLILQVLDASDAEVSRQYQTTVQVLEELGAKDIPRVDFLNKWDQVTSAEQLDRIHFALPSQALKGSALEGNGLDELKEALSANLRSQFNVYKIEVPFERSDIKALLHQNAYIQTIQTQENSYSITAFMSEKIQAQLKAAKINFHLQEDKKLP